MMRTEAEKMREENIGHIGQEIVNGVPIGGTVMAALINPSPYPT